MPGGRSIKAILLGGAAGVFVGPDALDTPLTFEGTRAIGATLGSGVVMVFDETADLVGTLRRIAAFFRDESCGQCVPCRVGTVRQEELLARLADRVGRSQPRRPRSPCSTSSARRCATRRICGLGQTASSAIESALAPAGAGGAVTTEDMHGRVAGVDVPIDQPFGLESEAPHPVSSTSRRRHARPASPKPPPRELPPRVSLLIDGAEVSVPAGSTILEACRAQGLDIPTLCYLENLTPVNVCRVCVVEVKGSRVLAPACSRKVEEGMEVQTESERVQVSRKVVLELLGSSVDVSLAGPRQPERRDRRLPRALRRRSRAIRSAGRPPRRPRERDARDPGHHHAADGRPSGPRRDRRAAGQGRQQPLRA